MKNVNSLTSTFKTILFLVLVLVFSNCSNIRKKESSSMTHVNNACEARLIQVDWWTDQMLSGCPNGKTAYIAGGSIFREYGSPNKKYATVFCC